MLAVLGFVTILLVLALIMSKKVSTLVALIFVPAITGFIAAFINAPNVIIQAAQAAAEKAGTAYVEPVITFGTRFTKALSILSADYMGKGLSSIVATGVMFIFAILFFSTCSDAGVFDPIINRILKCTGEDPVKVCIGTFLIGFCGEGPGLLAGVDWTQRVGLLVIALVAILYSAVITAIIAFALEKTIGWRVTEAQEVGGIDLADQGERAYDFAGTASSVLKEVK